eukprot:COSAG06_NODE_68722_length_207_cov_21.425926_1_plen_24_part_01
MRDTPCYTGPAGVQACPRWLGAVL